MTEEFPKEKIEQEEIFFQEEKPSQKPILKFLAALLFISLIFSFFFLFQWLKTNKKLKEKEKAIQETETAKENFLKEKGALEEKIKKLNDDLEASLKREGAFLEWEEFNALGLNFSYPKKWGKLTITSQKNNIFEFQTEDKDVDIVYYFKDSNALAFLEKKITHYNICTSSLPYYDKTIKMIFPEKKIIPVYYLAPPSIIFNCAEVMNQLPFGMINAILFSNDQYLAFLLHGSNWSVPKIIDIKTGENILEKTGIQFWFDPWEDIYFLEDRRIALTTFDLFPSHTSYDRPPFAPQEISIFVSEPNNPNSLKKIHSVETKDNPNLFFGNLEIQENKLFFFLFQGSVNPITRKRIILTKQRFVYDFSTQKVQEVK
ncbi:MAG: hypothetical protein ACPLZH_01755 [Minisyncoccales bacterium]